MEKENKQSLFKRVHKKFNTKKAYLIVGFFFGILWALTNSIRHEGDPLSTIIGCLFYIPVHTFMGWIIAKYRFKWYHLDEESYEEENQAD